MATRIDRRGGRQGVQPVPVTKAVSIQWDGPGFLPPVSEEAMRIFRRWATETTIERIRNA